MDLHHRRGGPVSPSVPLSPPHTHRSLVPPSPLPLLFSLLLPPLPSTTEQHAGEDGQLSWDTLYASLPPELARNLRRRAQELYAFEEEEEEEEQEEEEQDEE